ncbi:thioredoxin (clone GIF2) [Arabidopsis thaliana]|jgi:thioredoxin 1|uniref:Thioredoxin H2 n=3 Tax=Arabidopsis TaxID=3701 RepID=TRXH2_ARATH|nr:thioredoxin 2 [Arabidopsis thaliana]Q38879.2 RecName: Full=Thioredoxin H2; Short=AtTrxh2; AltName: Full=Thioredoxin 2; Short=AtTRX2 [Arabidopsis thaliana]KAG7611278.1 Thioredoxin domain [Arabidopsis suecica]AAK82498.1 AT5g39950/MYH19_110 [Arabidopsis thaliana]AAM47360.1 AT5g39950/MYH19_110 [Arabidopsis thaliana]AED94495.1 thioredoxin 2 [Arabidopsis thaliana]CAA84612.1 thioredoxin [Arabidopsis thaliana]|eukprot:NP_198811.1 thioredoxin 2 [Arabidopsis thaliana]
MGGALSTVFGSGEDATAAGTESEPSRVLKFSSSARWQLHFNEIKESNKLLVVDFSASWCGPCRMIEPAIHAMADKFNDVDFVKLDVDELPDVAKEFNVTAMPTFVLVKRGKEIERIIGAKKDELEKKVSKLRA